MKKSLLISVATLLSLSLLIVSCGGSSTESGSKKATLDAVKERGKLLCGVSTGLGGFSAPDSTGAWQGIDVDVCRAIAAAVFGDAEQVEYIPLNTKERFTALQSGEIDVLSRNTTWTETRDSSLGLNFAGVNYYDGQGFLVKKSLKVKSALELDGVSVCLQAGTTTELSLADYFRFNKMKYKTVSFDTSDQTKKGFEEGRCEVLTSDASQLAALRIKLSDPDSTMVLPEVISKEPLGPVVQQGDDQWFNIVKWTLFALVNAEEMGVDSNNVDSLKGSADSNPGVKRLLGDEGDMGKNLGLEADFVHKIISQVGNYGEMFDRNVGANSPLKIPRGVNRLWTKGGIMYVPPFR